MPLTRERRLISDVAARGDVATLPQRAPQSRASWIRPGRSLLVASTGGHLEQLFRLRQRFFPELD